MSDGWPSDWIIYVEKCFGNVIQKFSEKDLGDWRLSGKPIKNLFSSRTISFMEMGMYAK